MRFFRAGATELDMTPLSATAISLPRISDYAGLDALLAEAQWLVRATTESGVNEGTVGAALDATGAFALIGPSSWTGSALVGLMTKDAPYDDAGAWFTDLDISAVFSIPAHHDNGTGQWAEILHIPFTGGAGATEWFEFAVIFRDDGDLWIGFDFESGSETSVNEPTWVSGQVYADDSPNPAGVIGDWHDGVAEATWRLTIVAATGVVTLRKNGVTVVTDTMGAVAFPEPPDGEAIQVGPFAYVLPLKSVSLKDGIGGAEILGWSAASPTGWTAGTGSYVTTTPAAAFTAGGIHSVTIPDHAALDIAADADATFAFWFTTPYLADVDGEIYIYAAHSSGTIGGGGTGLEVRDLKIDAFGVDGFGALASDGSDNAFVLSNTGWAAGTHLVVVTVDRTADELTVYVDGTEHAQASIADVGAISPAADLTLGSAVHHADGKWSRLFTETEITVTLPAALGV